MKKLLSFSVASVWTLYVILGLADFGEAASKGKPGGGGTTDVNPEIVYIANQGRGTKIMVAKADGSSRVVVVDNGANNSAPIWSANGSHILFFSSVNGPGIYRVAIDRTTGLAQGSPVKIIPVGILGVYRKAAWSPKRFSDGKYMLAYVDIDGTGYASIYLQTIEDNGTPSSGKPPIELRNIIPRDSKFVNDYFPSWSPNGDALVVTAATATGGEPEPNYDVQVITLGECNQNVVCDLSRESLIHFLPNNEVSPLSFSVSYGFTPEWGAYAGLTDGGVLVQGPGSPSDPEPDIWIIPVSDPTQALNLTATQDRLESGQSWAPDGMIYSVRANDCNPICHDVAAIARRYFNCTSPCAETVLIKENYPVGGAKWLKAESNENLAIP